jgi:hypothetical protein
LTVFLRMIRRKESKERIFFLGTKDSWKLTKEHFRKVLETLGKIRNFFWLLKHQLLCYHYKQNYCQYNWRKNSWGDSQDLQLEKWLYWQGGSPGTQGESVVWIEEKCAWQHKLSRLFQILFMPMCKTVYIYILYYMCIIICIYYIIIFYITLHKCIYCVCIHGEREREKRDRERERETERLLIFARKSKGRFKTQCKPYKSI